MVAAAARFRAKRPWPFAGGGAAVGAGEWGSSRRSGLGDRGCFRFKKSYHLPDKSGHHVARLRAEFT